MTKAVLLIAFVVGLWALPYAAHASLQVGQVVNYSGRKWTVVHINQDKTVTLCPYYDYSHYFNGSNWGWFYNSKCRNVPISLFMPRRKQPSRQPYTPETVPHKLSDRELIRRATDPHYLNSLTAEEYRKMYARVRNIAVMHPTERNIAAYMYMTNFTRLKALIFSHAVVDYVMQHPRFNIQKTIGQTSWSYDSYLSISRQQKQAFINKHKKNLGILLFIKNGCPYCMKQIPVLNWFQADHHIDVLAVAQNSCPDTINIKCIVSPEAFRAYGIRYEPTIILVIKQPDGQPRFFPIGVGLTDEVTLFNRAYTFVHNYYHPQQQYTDENLYKLLQEGK